MTEQDSSALEELFDQMCPEILEDDKTWKEFFEPGMNGQAEFVPKLLGDAIILRTKFKTIKGSDKMYRYDEGVYKDDGREYIKSFSRRVLWKRFKTMRINEVINYIQAASYVGVEDIDPHWVNFNNGLLNIETFEFREHTPNIFTITRIPITYSPGADCPFFKEKLADKLPEHVITCLQEMFGYCYMPYQRHEVAFLFHGQKRTMKSTVLYLLGEMLGEDNITSFPLQQLTYDQFSTAYLFGKLANICADLDSEGLRNVGRFMMITGGDKITAGKKHEHHISFYPSSKLIFSCNVIPSTHNKDPAFYRRWIILPFDKQTPKEQIDPYMKDKLKKELPGILNWALEGLKRLQENKRFSYWLSEDEVKALYEKNSDSISAFIYAHINTESDDGVITKREVYKQYQTYCKENRIYEDNPIRFGRMFLALTGCGTCKKGVIPAYSGIEFTNTTNSVQKEINYEGVNKYLPLGYIS
jgi:putative DNA primase/helicase